MRAMMLTNGTGKLSDLVMTDIPVPEPGPGEVRVEVAYGGCNFADTMMWHGNYPHPRGYPGVAGIEIAGRVAAIGADVTGVAVGDRVAAVCEGGGGFADFAIAPAERLVPVPDAIGLDVAAASLVQAFTAWHLLHNVSTTRPGDFVLVHAIGGGVGLYLTQLIARAGAVVIGTVGTAGKEVRALEYGAARVINRNNEDFVAAVLEFTGGRMVDKIVDSTGASILDRSFATIRPLGHVVSYGEAEGKPFTNLWERLVAKSLTFTRFHLGHVDFGSEVWRRSISEINGAIADGSLRAPIEQVFPFGAVVKMYEALESRSIAGKLILSINPDI